MAKCIEDVLFMFLDSAASDLSFVCLVLFSGSIGVQVELASIQQNVSNGHLISQSVFPHSCLSDEGAS